MNARLAPAPSLPRLGFLGLGWIGRQRMEALVRSGAAHVAAIADVDAQARAAAATAAPDAAVADSLEALLALPLDGLVIATPSADHASQAIAALERGLAVFCQKPLACTAADAARILDAARRVDRLVEVDFSYRWLAGVAALRDQVRSGELGELYAVELAFHNAYGPDKAWFYDRGRSGGGCVMDLGVHLIDLAQWIGGCDGADALDARLYARGRRLAAPVAEVEDYASVQWRSRGGANVRLSCSWRLQAGCDAVIEAAFYGSAGGAALRNVEGSFYDFTVDRFDGTRRRRLAAPPDAWGGRALVDFAARLGTGGRYDAGAERFLDVARVVDAIYGR